MYRIFVYKSHSSRPRLHLSVLYLMHLQNLTMCQSLYIMTACNWHNNLFEQNLFSSSNKVCFTVEIEIKQEAQSFF